MGGDRLDDAGIIELNPDLALVQTVDFFTPIVDDGEDFGFIAAVNALSDIYAMGGEPLSALAVAGFAPDVVPLSVLGDIFRGGAQACAREGVVLLGGHTVRSPEIFYGLAVTGTVHPRRFLTKAGAQPGDLLVLTKPLGTGLLSTWLKRGQMPEEFLQPLVASMKESNLQASRVLREHAHALTDVTGFGLLGHALEMAKASGVAFELWASAVPLLPGAMEAACAKAVAGGLKANRAWVGERVSGWELIPEEWALILCDPQTSGGLLAAVPAQSAKELLEKLPHAAVIGTVISGTSGTIALTMEPRR